MSDAGPTEERRLEIAIEMLPKALSPRGIIAYIDEPPRIAEYLLRVGVTPTPERCNIVWRACKDLASDANPTPNADAITFNEILNDLAHLPIVIGQPDQHSECIAHFYMSPLCVVTYIRSKVPNFQLQSRHIQRIHDLLEIALTIATDK